MLSALVSSFQRLAAKRMFSRWSPIYEEEVADNAYSAADETAKVALKYLAKQDMQEPLVADIGIGTGLLAQQIYDAYPCRITGLDFNEEMMTLCSARDITELLIKCDVGRDRWPLQDNSMSLVCASGLLEYLTDEMVQHFIVESARTLQQNGIVVFTYIPQEPGEKKMNVWRGHSGTYLTCRYAPDAMEALINKAGLRVLEHSQPFKGCVFGDGSFYNYRLIAAQKI